MIREAVAGILFFSTVAVISAIGYLLLTSDIVVW
jgi:hypothetical protein